MKMVYTNESNVLVNNAKNMLVNEGVPVSVRNEHSSTGAYTNVSYMELWVNRDSDYSRAIELLSALNHQGATKEWTCSQCGEKNDGSFEICWNCRSEP